VNRDQVPSATDVALAAAELMATARRLTARLPRLGVSTPAQLASAVAVVRTGVREIWPAVVPEAARE
jgi:hypothetical protein